jgi:hypothetical protein
MLEELKKDLTKVAMIIDLINAQKSFPAIGKDRVGRFGAYATLGEVLAVKEALNANGFFLMQSENEDGTKIETRLVHKSGEEIVSRYTIKAESDQGGISASQAHGKAMTYARRYGLMMALGLASEDDPDPDDKQGPPPSQKQAAKPSAPPEPIKDDTLYSSTFPRPKPLTAAQETLKARCAEIADKANEYLKLGRMTGAYRTEIGEKLLAAYKAENSLAVEQIQVSMMLAVNPEPLDAQALVKDLEGQAVATETYKAPPAPKPDTVTQETGLF